MTTTDSRAPERVLDQLHRATTLGLLALVTMFAFEAVAVSLAMPSVARDLDGATLYPIAVIGMLTASILGMVVGGVWSDARSASLPISGGGAVFVVGLLASGFAATMEVFVAGRLLQGLGAGAALTGMYVAVADAYPAHLRTRVFALFATAWVLPSIAGPFVAGALVDLVGWRSVFLVVAGFAALSILAVRASVGSRLTVRDGAVAWGRRPAYALLAALAAVLLHVAGHGAGLRAGLLLLLGLALLLLALPRLLPRGTLRAAPGLPAVIASRGLIGGAFACAELFLPLVLQDETGMSPTTSGLVMMVGALGWTAGSAWSGRHAGPGNTRSLLVAGAATVLAGGVILLAVVPVDHLLVPAATLSTLGFVVMAVGMGLATPLMSSRALDLAEPGKQGESGSSIQMSDALGQSVAAGVVGAVFARWFLVDQDTSYLSGFGLAVLLAALAVAVVGRGAKRQDAGD